jgi:hypothetical protein
MDAVYLLVVKRPAQAADIEIDFHINLLFLRSLPGIRRVRIGEDKESGWRGESEMP